MQSDQYADIALNIPCDLQTKDPLPDYLRDTYTWAYLNPFSVALFDRHWMVSAILLGNYTKLEQATLDEIDPGLDVLQPACVYGRYSSMLARQIGPQGRLDVIDVAPIQVANCQAKLAATDNAHARQANAIAPGSEMYDAVTCFFLLHEVPEPEKKLIVDALLARLKPDGKLIFVDYHRPHWAHPFKALISIIFATLEPYARMLWYREISEYATDRSAYRWKKTTYFGGMYQKVVVRRPG